MTIAVNFTTVTNSIAALTVAGVTIKDVDEIPMDALKILPVMFPKPDNFITNVTFSRETYGTGGTAKMNFSYTLNYRYLHSPVGARLNMLSAYSGLITNLAAILVEIFENDKLAGLVDLQLESIGQIGPLTDLAGQTTYHGVDIGLRVLEFAQ